MCSFRVYSIYRTNLGAIGCGFVLSFLICFKCMKLYCTFLNFTCMRGDTEKIKKTFSIKPISANPRIVLCSVLYRRRIARRNFSVIGWFSYEFSRHYEMNEFSYPNIRIFNNSLGWGQQKSSRFYLDSNGKFEFYFPNLK